MGDGRGAGRSWARWLPWLFVPLALGVAIWMLREPLPDESAGLPADAAERESDVKMPTLVGGGIGRKKASLDVLIQAFSQANETDAMAEAKARLRRRALEDPSILKEIVAAIRAPLPEPRDWQEVYRRQFLFEVLGTLGPAGARELAALLEDPPPGLPDAQRAALSVLTEMGEEAAPAVDAILCYYTNEKETLSRGLALTALGTVGAAAREAGPILHELLLPPVDDALAAYAAPALISIEGPTAEVLATFRAAIEDEDTERRAAVLHALVKAGPGAASFTSLLLTLIDDIESQVRVAAARVLGAIGAPGKQIIQALREQLQLEREQDKRLVAEALIQLGPDGREAVRSVAASGDDVTDRLAAAEALVKIDGLPPENAKDLVWIVEEEKHDLAFRRRALGALKQMPPSPEGSRVVKLLVRLLDEEAFRRQAIQGLAANPDSAVRAHLHAWAAKADEEGRFLTGAALRSMSHDVAIATEMVLRVAEEAEDARWARQALTHLMFFEPRGDESRIVRLLVRRIEEDETFLSPSVVSILGRLPAHGKELVPILLRALWGGNTQWAAAYGLTAFPDYASTSVPALLDAYATYGERAGFRYPPRPIGGALETLGPAWSGTRAALDAAIQGAPAAGKPYLEALRPRILR